MLGSRGLFRLCGEQPPQRTCMCVRAHVMIVVDRVKKYVICLYVCMNICVMCLCMFMRKFMWMCMCVCVCVCVYVRLCMRMRICQAALDCPDAECILILTKPGAFSCGLCSAV